MIRAVLAFALLGVAGCITHQPKLVPTEYFTRFSSPRIDNKTGNCEFTVWAWVTQQRPHILRVQGIELGLDTSWGFRVPIPSMQHGDGLIVEFLKPDTREVVSTHELSESCWGTPNNTWGQVPRNREER